MQDHTDDIASHHACPPWCGRDHSPGPHPDDQHHASLPRSVALVTGASVLEPDDLAVAGIVIVRLFRRTHGDVTWVEVVCEEDRDVRMVTTLESARRLLTVLHELLSGARD